MLLAKAVFDAFKNNPLQQYLVLTSICALISTLALYWCVIGTRKRVKVTEQYRLQNLGSQESLPYLEQLKILFSNRPFVYVIGIYLCSWLAVQNTVAIIPYFVKNYMGLGDQDFINIILAVQGTSMIMLFVWTEVSKRLGKKAVYFMGMSLWIVAEVGLFFLQPGQVGMMYLLAIMAGFGVSTAYLIPWSMMPDVIELDELNTGQRREGIFYGFMVLLQKMALALGLFLVGWVLQQTGFIESAAGQPAPIQPESALTAIRWMVGPAPLFMLSIGLVLAYLYPITKEVHAEILLRLSERRQPDISDL